MTIDRFASGTRVARCLAAALLAGALASGPAGLHAQAPATTDIVVGQVVSRSAGLAETGREIALGAQACVQWVNAAGGVRGRRLRLVARDDGGDPQAALGQAQELLAREAIVALLTPMGRAAASSVLPWAAQEGLAVVAPYGAGAMAAQAGTLATSFFLRTHPSVEALRLTTQMQTLGIERIAVLYSDDNLGRETLAAFEEAIASTGAAAVALVPLGGMHTAPALLALAKAAPQAVLLATIGEQTQAVLRGLDSLAREGRKIVPYALSSAASREELRSVGPSARWLVVSQVVPSPRAVGLPLVKSYREALRQAGDPQPSYPSLEGCVAVLTLAQALRKGGDAPTRAGTLKALRGAGIVDLGGWTVDLADRQRPGSRFTDITLIGADGRWTH